jgi:iron complex outermembrane receptor protein
MLLRSMVAVAFLFILTSPGLAQTLAPTGKVEGRVADPSGAVIVGADVFLEPAAGGPSRSTVTDGEGRFGFEALSEGAYVVTAVRPGMAPETLAVDVAAGQTSDAGITIAPDGVREDVTVTATRVATPLASIPNTVTIVSESTIDQRTAVSDDLASVLESNVPGFAPSMKKMSGRGETLRGRNPLYAINGVPQHTPLRDGERDGHTIDLDFVERIEVIHGANAIQGIGATGGVVNLVTKAPRDDGSWTHDVKLSTGNTDAFERDGWSNKFSYLVGKRAGRLSFVAGLAVQKRGLFFDGSGEAIGLYPTQGDIMDSTARGLYAKAGVDLTSTRRLEMTVNDFRLERDGDFVTVPGNRATGQLTRTVAGDPRTTVGDPAKNTVLTISADYRDKDFLGGDAALQLYAQDFNALFEGGGFTTFALQPGGPAFLDQSEITTRKVGAKLTYAMPQVRIAGITPTFGLDASQDRSAQVLARTGRTWVPGTVFREVAPFVQLQRLVLGRLLVSGGARLEVAQVRVDDFTTLPSSNSTFVSGGSPSFTEVLPNVGAVLPVGERASIYSSFSQGFTMPDVGRVLRAVNVPGQDVDTLVDIVPVIASNIEVGGDYRLGPARVSAAYYRSNSDRGSLLDRDAEGIFHVRRQPTTIDGVDLAARVSFLHERARTGGNFSWIRGRYDSDRNGSRDTDLDGLNIAPNRLNVYVEGTPFDRATARLQVSTLLQRSFSGLAARPGFDFSGYTTADASLAFTTRAGVLRVGIENVLDRQYVVYFSQVDTAGTNDSFFSGPGRSFTVSIERRF